MNIATAGSPTFTSLNNAVLEKSSTVLGKGMAGSVRTTLTKMNVSYFLNFNLIFSIYGCQSNSNTIISIKY